MRGSPRQLEVAIAYEQEHASRKGALAALESASKQQEEQDQEQEEEA